MARRMAAPSTAIDGGKGEPALPPPVIHSWTRILRTGREVVTTVVFRIIPVIDLKGGMAVHAVGGRREQYRPLRSVWQASDSPIALAAALWAGTDLDTLYVADLDAIAGHPPHRALYQGLAREGWRPWIDTGVRDLRSMSSMLDLEHLEIVAGLETMGGPHDLSEVIDAAGRERVVFSLDMDAGRPRIAPGARWPEIEPLAIASRAIDLGVRRMILLDLSRVGTGRGVGTEDLLGTIRARYPGIDVVVGGGIRGIDDVRELRERGAAGVLVGSALHDGRIGPRELEPFSARPG